MSDQAVVLADIAGEDYGRLRQFAAEHKLTVIDATPIWYAAVDRAVAANADLLVVSLVKMSPTQIDLGLRDLARAGLRCLTIEHGEVFCGAGKSYEESGQFGIEPDGSQGST